MNSGYLQLAGAIPAVLLLSANTALAQAAPERSGRADYWGHGMMWDGGYWGGFGFLFGPIIMILVLVAIVAGVLYLLRAFGNPSHAAQQDSSGGALAILDERFARGEIDAAEYHERKKQLLSR